jgi:hypothetical protein
MRKQEMLNKGSQLDTFDLSNQVFEALQGPKQAFVKDCNWSMSGAHFDEKIATKLPIEPWFPAAAMEQADRKSLRPESRRT